MHNTKGYSVGETKLRFYDLCPNSRGAALRVQEKSKSQGHETPGVPKDAARLAPAGVRSPRGKIPSTVSLMGVPG